jgi:hypothetical protein
MKNAITTFGLFVLLASQASAYTVSVDTYVANAGKTVTVPVMIDDVAGLSYADATLTYDPQVLVVTKAEAGTLKSVMADDFTTSDTNGTINVTIFANGNVAAGSGSIANITFALREGTDGQYSDIAVSEVSLGEATGVKDVTYGKTVNTVNGMVRVMATSAQVTRLESAETICADTVLGTLALDAGDAIQASDSQTAIRVAGAVTASGAIAVKAPVNGWASGTYALLSTTTAGLTFTGVDGTITSETANGITTYYAAVTVAGELPLVAEDSEEVLTAGDKNLIRANAQAAFAGKTDSASLALKALYESASRIQVVGPKGSIGVIADMGIAPAFAPALDATGTLKLTYAMPQLVITSFDAQTGAVRFKVTPGEGNQIVSEIATGYIHVFGTNNLGEKMRYISSVGFDLTPYLKAETKGEGVLNVTLGTHTFLKVKVENVSRKEGDRE